MRKIYDDFVKRNPTLFKVATLDLFVKVGSLSQDVYVDAKSAVEAYQSQLKAKETEATSASVSSSQNISSDSANQNSLVAQSVSESGGSSASSSTENSSETTTIV